MDGTYKFSDIVLTLAKAQYDFKNTTSNASLLSGTYILDSTKKVVTLFKPDKSLMSLSIDANGNLVTSKGYVTKNNNNLQYSENAAHRAAFIFAVLILQARVL